MSTPTTAAPPTRPLAETSLWRDVHKGIRLGLARLMTQSGITDPADAAALDSLNRQVISMVGLLESHARAEDQVTGPVIDMSLPHLGSEIAAAHLTLGVATSSLLAAGAALQTANDRRRALQTLHLDVARFAGDYLLHQEFEERVVLPALEAAVGVDEVRRLEVAFIASIPPQEKLDGMESMFAAMNVEELTEVLSMIRAGAPRPWFESVWAVAVRVVEPTTLDSLRSRLHLA